MLLFLPSLSPANVSAFPKTVPSGRFLLLIVPGCCLLFKLFQFCSYYCSCYSYSYNCYICYSYCRHSPYSATALAMRCCCCSCYYYCAVANVFATVIFPPLLLLLRLFFFATDPTTCPVFATSSVPTPTYGTVIVFATACYRFYCTYAYASNPAPTNRILLLIIPLLSPLLLNLSLLRVFF